jgi:hypothetical protein
MFPVAKKTTKYAHIPWTKGHKIRYETPFRELFWQIFDAIKRK